MPASNETRRRAEEALRSLESHWISLLRWLAQSLGLSDDDFLAGWKSDVYLTSRDRLEKDARGMAEVPWTVLNYLDFGRYPELAGTGEYGRKLEQLGTPPRDWRAVLDHLNKTGCITYRNHLAHGGRFDALPTEKQEEAARVLAAQRGLLKSWWPDAPVAVQIPIREESPYRTAIRLLTPDPNSAASLVEQLGMRFVANAPDLISGSVATPLTEVLGPHFRALHRVGEADLDGVNAAVYLAYLPEWHLRSSEREKSRRKLAKALIDFQTQDPRWLAVMMDGTGKTAEAEFIVPRQRTGKAFGTIRAAVDLLEPNRYHVELLDELKVRPGTTLPELSRQWNQALSVERVTKRFYGEFRELRDRIIEALLEHNADNPAIAGKDRKSDKVFELQLHAFGTRQLGRMLFLWFIQQKRWLGGSAGDGETDFILDLFRKHSGEGDGFYNDVLLPVFFEGLGLPIHHANHRAVEARFGAIPYLGGGLFRAGADEFEGQILGLQPDGTRANRISLANDLFDPLKDVPSEGSRPSTARTVLGLLRGYRFTTQESTPDDQSVDPDPELLGKVFENLYQGDDRHDSGAYYTPREIVHFMCRQALDGYLRSRAGVDQATLDWLREEALDWTASDRQLTPAERSALVEALDEVKIVDPAVGSGAFLVASVQEIVLLRRGIVQSADDRDIDAGSVDVAEWKRRTITNSLYGVDINPMAVEICQLRLWLSMVVELDVSNYHDIHSLPNLDLRVVAGDSLIDRMGEERFVHSLGGEGGVQANFETVGIVDRLLNEIEKLQHRFAGEGVHGPMLLVRWRNEIRHKQMEIAQIQLDDAISRGNEILAKAKRNPKTTQRAVRTAESHIGNLQDLRDKLRDDAPYQKPFLWPVNFPEIFERGGFDIVVANPPYVRAESLDAVDQESYSHAFPGVYSGSADLLVYFYARAVQILRPGGEMAFITSNKYMRAAYGENIRAYLPKNLQIRQVIDFGDLPLFSVAAYPAVLTGAKCDDPELDAATQVADLVYPIRRRLAADELSVNTDNVRLALQALPEILEEAAARDYPQVLLRKEGWILEDPALVRLFERLMNEGTPLGEYVKGRMYYGIKTGLNPAFVIDQAKRDELVAADPRSAEIIKPWLRGRDIKRWKAEWAGLYIIAIQNSGDADARNPWGEAKTEAESRRIFEKTYPAIHEHISRWEEYPDPRNPGKMLGLRPRADQGRWWWELRACTYYGEFQRPKVCWPEFPRHVRFCWVEAGALANNKCYLWADPPRWILGVLNSVLMEFLLCHITTRMGGGYLQLYDHFVRRLPVVMPETGIQHRLDAIVRRMVEAPTNTESELELWELVRSIYAMTGDESRLIRDWYGRTQVLADDTEDDDNHD